MNMNDFIQTPFNYTGSKYKLLPQLLPEFDYTKSIFVDVFCGGGSVYTNVLDKYKYVYVNDILTDLIHIMKHLLNDKHGFITELKTFIVDKEDQDGYNKLRSDYNNYKDSHTHTRFFSLLLSCTNNMLRLNNKFEFNQTFGRRSYNNSTEQKINEWVEYVNSVTNRNRDKQLKLLSFSFDNLITNEFNNTNKLKETMFYFDPPYGYVKNVDGTIGKKQISEAGYNAFWKQQDEINLYNSIIYLNKQGSSFGISGVLEHDGQTCWILDKLKSDGFKVVEFNHNYNNVSRNKVDKGTKEVFIKNY